MAMARQSEQDQGIGGEPLDVMCLRSNRRRPALPPRDFWPMLFGRSQKAGTMRSPKRASDRIAGVGCCDQPIGLPQPLAFIS
jgi:hypothetical protein